MTAPVEKPSGSLSDLVGRSVVSVEHAGRLLGLSAGSAYAAADRGEIPTRRYGKRRVVPVPALLLQLLGVKDIPAFLGELGVRDLPGLLEFLTGARWRPPERPTPDAADDGNALAATENRAQKAGVT